MTVYQIIDGKKFLNGVEFEQKELEQLDNKKLLKRLSDMQYIINQRQNTLDILMKQRANLVKISFDNGASAIQIADTLKMTRQRVYKIIESLEEEE
jgi:DNA-binding MarR family transcriptional regulator